MTKDLTGKFDKAADADDLIAHVSSGRHVRLGAYTPIDLAKVKKPEETVTEDLKGKFQKESVEAEPSEEARRFILKRPELMQAMAQQGGMGSDAAFKVAAAAARAEAKKRDNTPKS